jgi:hypothetical protein
VSSPIIEHPDVRRMLYTMKASIDAMRALIYTNAGAMDLAVHHPDEAVRAENQELVELLIPLSKAWCTDLGSEVTSLAIQVHGGMGYIEETGVAQHYRDARITAIYEGTNGIQAMDLVGRKLPMRGGGVVADHIARMRAVLDDLSSADPAHGLGPSQVALASAIDATESATNWIIDHGLADPVDALAAATPYLRMMAVTTGGWLMARQALAAAAVLDGDAGAAPALDEESAAAKLAVARFFCEQRLGEVDGLLGAVTIGGAALYSSDPSTWAG